MKSLFAQGRAASLAAAAVMVLQPHIFAANAAPSPAPQPAAPAAPKVEPMRTVDVALDAGRGFTGQVVDVAGRPVAGAAVTLTNGKVQRSAVSDAQGAYRIADVTGGAYLVRVGDQWKQARAWAPGTAPPSANRGLMMVHGDQLIRGQAYCGSGVGCGNPVAAGFGGMREALSHPLVVGGLIAAAIAIPVAIHNSDDDDDAS